MAYHKNVRSINYTFSLPPTTPEAAKQKQKEKNNGISMAAVMQVGEGNDRTLFLIIAVEKGFLYRSRRG